MTEITPIPGLWAYWTWVLDPKANDDDIKGYKHDIREYVIKRLKKADLKSGTVPPHKQHCKFSVTGKGKSSHSLQLHATVTINPPPVATKGGANLKPPTPPQPPPPPFG